MELHLPVELGELRHQLVPVTLEQMRRTASPSGMHDPEAHRQHDPALERLLEHPGVDHELRATGLSSPSGTSLTIAAVSSPTTVSTLRPPMPLPAGGGAEARTTP